MPTTASTITSNPRIRISAEIALVLMNVNTRNPNATEKRPGRC
jgi:hypothetical protein